MTTLYQVTLCVNRRARTFRVSTFQVCVETREHRSREHADVSLSLLRPFAAFLMERGYTAQGGDSGITWYQRITDSETLAAG